MENNLSGPTRNRTSTIGFGDRCSTTKLWTRAGSITQNPAIGRVFLELFLYFLKRNTLSYNRIVLFDFNLPLYLLAVFAGVIHVVTLRAFYLNEILLWHIFPL